MTSASLIGHITVKDPEKWNSYRERVPSTLKPWGAEIIFRGKCVEVLEGKHPYSDVVVISFPNKAAIDGWHNSPAYQALIPLRREAAEVVLLACETPPG
ncbi:MAG: DUF1330 domain-containing protein [Sideroxyarcus sp.]|nr:DUF1330 domain-containing protein [Sideroxyarcus sp.]